MLRTNNKEVRRKVRRYIIRGYESGMNEYDINNVDTTDIDQVSNSIMYYFKLEYLQNNVNYKKGRISRQDAFEDYCKGMPTLIDTYYYLGGAKYLLGSWLDETEEEIDRYTEEQASHMITYLIYSELTKALK